MAKGGQAPTQTTQTTVQLSPEQRELYNLAIPGVRSFAATVPERYQGQTVAGFDPAQTSGQNMALDAATGAQANLAGQAAGATGFLLNDIWNPSSNPNLQGAIDAAVRPITTAYQTVARPQIRDEFASSQPFGGSRRGVAESLTADAYLRNVGDTSSKIVQDQYSNNLAAYVKALGLVPYTQQAQLAPAMTTSGVGDVRQNLEQQLLNMQVGNFNYDQLAPFLQSQDILALMQGIPGGTTTATATGSVPQRNPVTGALGGAATGASLGSAIMPGFGTAAGAGLGALLSFL